MTKFGAAENEMERLTAKFAQRTPTEHSLLLEYCSESPILRGACLGLRLLLLECSDSPEGYQHQRDHRDNLMAVQ